MGDSVEVRSREELRDWLAENHARSGSVWLIVWKKGTPHHLPWSAAVSELLCWGWIDSVPRKVDAQRTSFRIARRDPKSAWSAINKAKVAEERAAGRMTPAGEAAIAVAQANGMWEFLDDVEALILPEDLAGALATSGLRDRWDDWPASVQRGTLEWIKSAKTVGTRGQRLTDVVQSLDAGLRPKPFRR